MDVTYPEVGATRADPLPPGYGHVLRDATLGTGVFERAATALFDWRMHSEAGLTVLHTDGRAAPGVKVILRAGWGRAALAIPCQVIYTINEPHRQGFAYGTLPGHPERGEEAFVLSRGTQGEVRFHIRAFSRPASLLARAGGPVTRLAQHYMTNRYISALRSLAQP